MSVYLNHTKISSWSMHAHSTSSKPFNIAHENTGLTFQQQWSCWRDSRKFSKRYLAEFCTDKMGCDGGTIPRRDELVRLKKKPEQVGFIRSVIQNLRHCTASAKSFEGKSEPQAKHLIKIYRLYILIWQCHYCVVCWCSCLYSIYYRLRVKSTAQLIDQVRILPNLWMILPIRCPPF